MSVYNYDPETGAPRSLASQPTGRDVEPPRGPFTVDGEAGLRGYFPGMDRETARRLVDEANDGYAPGSPDTLGRFVMEVRNPVHQGPGDRGRLQDHPPG